MQESWTRQTIIFIKRQPAAALMMKRHAPTILRDRQQKCLIDWQQLNWQIDISYTNRQKTNNTQRQITNYTDRHTIAIPKNTL